MAANPFLAGDWKPVIPDDYVSVFLNVALDLQSLSFVTFIHLVVCLTTGPKPLPKRPLHIVRSRASLKWEYPLLSLSSSSSFLLLLPRLPVTSIPPPFIFPSITRCRRQFLRKMWPIQLAFPLLISCRIFLCSLALSNTSSYVYGTVHHLYSWVKRKNQLDATYFIIYSILIQCSTCFGR